MGSLLLQIGQAGNQIGLQLLDYIEQTGQFFDESYIKRSDQNVMHSIHIDTEPKILKPLIDNRKRYWYVDPKNVIYFQHGRGNNWALGYMDDKKVMQVQEQKKFKEKVLRFDKFMDKASKLIDIPTLPGQMYSQQNLMGQQDSVPSSVLLKENHDLLDSVSEMIRREIEKIDYFIGIFMICSLGGGTGSGLCSRLIEEFRDQLQDVSIINTVIFPNQTGETTLQHYNSLLTLANLQQSSDCIIYFQNDKVNNYLNYARSKSIDKVVDLSNINQYIASQLLNLLRINDYSTYNRFYFDLLLDAAPLDDYKFVELASTPYFYDKTQSSGPECTWEKACDIVCEQVNVEESYLTEEINLDEKNDIKEMEMQLKNKKNKKKNVSISVQTVFRSGDIRKSLQGQEAVFRYIEKKMNSVYNPVRWNPDCFNFEYCEEKVKMGMDNKMQITVANRSSVASLLKDVSDIAYSKFKANAYLQWYYKYGLERDDFENAFLVMDNIYENYSELK